MHLDPDFEMLTYGDQGRRAMQIRNLSEGDLLAFYASLRDTMTGTLVYALIGVFVIDEIVSARDVSKSRWGENAHTRRFPAPTDVVVRAKRRGSGRLRHCIPIGEYRDRAYRVTKGLLRTWGGLSVNDGYLQWSARSPAFLNPQSFYQWLTQTGRLIQINN